MNCPDQFAWEVFVEINSPLASGLPAWHAYATDAETFPKHPVPSVCETPEGTAEYCANWPTTNRPLIIKLAKPVEDDGKLPINLHLSSFLGNIELSHRNKASFDYIVTNQLWYQQGLADTFTRRFIVDFPLDSIEIKTNWVDLALISEASRKTYHSVKYNDKNWGLIAMHITTSDLPKWFWATFEHVDNPGRCDWLGCRDSFGVTPAITPAQKPLYNAYPAEKVNPPLQTMLANIDPVFQHYRLKGSQVDYVDDIGNPRLLGNSVTEFSFIQNSSCITCHARAAVNWKGENGFGGFGNTPGNKSPENGLPTAGTVAPTQSFSGAPDPRWFTSANGSEQLHTMDFLWAMPFRAKPAFKDISAAKAAIEKAQESKDKYY